MVVKVVTGVIDIWNEVAILDLKLEGEDGEGNADNRIRGTPSALYLGFTALLLNNSLIHKLVLS